MWIIAAILLIVLAFVCKLLLPRNSASRYPGGWPIGSHYHRLDEFAFSILLRAGIITGVIAVVRFMAK
jgi:hypothetical protein